MFDRWKSHNGRGQSNNKEDRSGWILDYKMSKKGHFQFSWRTLSIEWSTDINNTH